MITPCSYKFKMINIYTYDEAHNPLEHIDYFKGWNHRSTFASRKTTRCHFGTFSRFIRYATIFHQQGLLVASFNSQSTIAPTRRLDSPECHVVHTNALKVHIVSLQAMITTLSMPHGLHNLHFNISIKILYDVAYRATSDMKVYH